MSDDNIHNQALGFEGSIRQAQAKSVIYKPVIISNFKIVEFYRLGAHLDS